jgi:hypothetical protein
MLCGLCRYPVLHSVCTGLSTFKSLRTSVLIKVTNTCGFLLVRPILDGSMVEMCASYARSTDLIRDTAYTRAQAGRYQHFVSSNAI